MKIKNSVLTLSLAWLIIPTLQGMEEEEIYLEQLGPSAREDFAQQTSGVSGFVWHQEPEQEPVFDVSYKPTYTPPSPHASKQIEELHKKMEAEFAALIARIEILEKQLATAEKNTQRCKQYYTTCKARLDTYEGGTGSEE